MTVGLAHARNTATVLAYLARLPENKYVLVLYQLVDDNNKFIKMNNSCVRHVKTSLSEGSGDQLYAIWDIMFMLSP